jgi:hypothetical protein
VIVDALDHPKMFALRENLKIDHPTAVGLIESLILITAYLGPKDGGIGGIPNKDIAAKLRWPGDPDALIQAMVDAGWLDEHPDPKVRLVIHDWPDHCPEYIHTYLYRNGKLFADGTFPNDAKTNISERPKCLAKFKANGIKVKLSKKSVRTKGAQDAHDGGTDEAQEALNEPQSNTIQAMPIQDKPKKKKSAAVPAVVPPDLASDDFLAAWREWVAKRKPTPEAQRRQLIKIAKHGGAAAGVWAIDMSLTNDWQGLFPERYEGKGGDDPHDDGPIDPFEGAETEDERLRIAMDLHHIPYTEENFRRFKNREPIEAIRGW